MSQEAAEKRKSLWNWNTGNGRPTYSKTLKVVAFIPKTLEKVKMSFSSKLWWATRQDSTVLLKDTDRKKASGSRTVSSLGIYCQRGVCVSYVCHPSVVPYTRTHTHRSNKQHLMTTHTHTVHKLRCDFCVTLTEIYSGIQPSAGSNVLIVWGLIMHEVSKCWKICVPPSQIWQVTLRKFFHKQNKKI